MTTPAFGTGEADVWFDADAWGFTPGLRRASVSLG